MLVKNRLEELDMIQDELAERLGVTQGGLGHWLNNRRQPPFEMLIRIADELKLDRAALGAAVLCAPNQAAIARSPFERTVLKICSTVPEAKQERFLGWLEAKMEGADSAEAAQSKKSTGGGR